MRQGDLDAADLGSFTTASGEDGAAIAADMLAPFLADAPTYEDILTGRLTMPYEEAFAALAASLGLAPKQVQSRLYHAMIVALYLADCKVAELRAAREPAQVAALAAPVVDRFGFMHLIKIHNRESDAYVRGDDAECKRIFPKQGRLGAAVDAAFRWDWKQMPPEWIAAKRRAVGGKVHA